MAIPVFVLLEDLEYPSASYPVSTKAIKKAAALMTPGKISPLIRVLFLLSVFKDLFRAVFDAMNSPNS